MSLGRSAEEIQEQVVGEREEVARTDREAKTAGDEHTEACAALRGLTVQRGELVSRRDGAEQARARAVDGIRALGALGMFTAASDAGSSLIEDEREAGAWTLTQTLDRIRSLPPAFATAVDTKRLEHLANDVSSRVDTLALELNRHEMQASIRHQDGLLVCEVSWMGAPTPAAPTSGSTPSWNGTLSCSTRRPAGSSARACFPSWPSICAAKSPRSAGR